MRPRSTPLLLLATGGLLLARLPLLPRREFDPDELEHAHTAWLWFKGMLPYKDFFEHHTPWYYYVLRPFYNWFAVDTSFEGARHFLLFGRGLSFALTVAALGLVILIGRLCGDRRTGAVGALLLASQPIFLQKTVEMRPDLPALVFFLGGLACLLRGLAVRAVWPSPRLRWFVAGGLGVGAAIMCTQKVLFVLPGAFAGLGLWALSGGKEAAPRRIGAVLAFGLGVVVPGALTWAAFALHGAGREFITNNFLLNARWKSVVTRQFVKLLATSGPILGLSLVGIAAALHRWFRAGEIDHRQRLLIAIVIGLFAGLIVMPSAHRQYYLMPLAILCLFAADGLFWIVHRLQERMRAPFIAFATIGLAVFPAIAFHHAYHEPNDRQLAQLGKVFERTAPTDVVMDGWQGMGIFRPHAFHYFFLHPEIRAMLPAPEWDAYLDALERGMIRPRLIAMDSNLRAMGPRFVGFVERNYVSDDGFLYFARDDQQAGPSP